MSEKNTRLYQAFKVSKTLPSSIEKIKMSSQTCSVINKVPPSCGRRYGCRFFQGVPRNKLLRYHCIGGGPSPGSSWWNRRASISSTSDYTLNDRLRSWHLNIIPLLSHAQPSLCFLPPPPALRCTSTDLSCPSTRVPAPAIRVSLVCISDSRQFLKIIQQTSRSVKEAFKKGEELGGE